MKNFVVPCILLTVVQVVQNQELDIRFRSKGDPLYLQEKIEFQDDFNPSQMLAHQSDQDLLLPYRKSPKEPTEESSASGLSIVVDDRTFDILGQSVNKNVGRIVKSAAKDWRTVVDNLGKSLKNYITPSPVYMSTPTIPPATTPVYQVSSTPIHIGDPQAKPSSSTNEVKVHLYVRMYF